MRKKRPYKFYIYLDKTNGKTIAIKGVVTPKPRDWMHVVYEWNVEAQKYSMACFPEIPNYLLFSDRFLLIGKTLTK